jgi:hypothetical protein
MRVTLPHLRPLLLISALAPAAFAEEPPPVTDPAAPAASEAAFDANAISKSATRKYQQGEYSEATGELLDAISTCDSLPRTTCADEQKAIFYRDLGIVYAGGLDKHHDGVKAFEEALRLDPEIDVPRILDTPPVRAAYDEARGVAPVAPAPAAAPIQASDLPPDESRSRYTAGDVLLRVGGRVRVSGLLSSVNGSSRGAAQLGAEANVLVHPGAMPLVVGAGFDVSDNIIPSSGTSPTSDFGSWSAAALVGGAFRGVRNTGYVLGGFGAQGLPLYGQNAPMLRVLGGASFGGFDFGGGLDVGFYSGGVSFVSFGLHLGWANYLK